MRSRSQVIKRQNELVDEMIGAMLMFQTALSPLVSDCEDKGVNSGRLVACITTLYLFSKIKTQLMVKHAMTMQPYLTTKCNVSTKPLGLFGVCLVSLHVRAFFFLRDFRKLIPEGKLVPQPTEQTQGKLMSTCWCNRSAPSRGSQMKTQGLF